ERRATCNIDVADTTLIKRQRDRRANRRCNEIFRRREAEDLLDSKRARCRLLCDKHEGKCKDSSVLHRHVRLPPRMAHACPPPCRLPRLSPLRRGTLTMLPLVRGSAAAGGRGSVTQHSLRLRIPRVATHSIARVSMSVSARASS